VALAGVGQAQAQVNLYTFSQANGTYTPITSGTVPTYIAAPTVPMVNTVTTTDPYPGPTDDAVSSAVTIPFAFTFNGVAYTVVRLSSNGFLAFGTTPTPATGNYTPLSATTAYGGAVSALGSDLAGAHSAGNLGEVRYETLGISPNRTFVAQWSNFVRIDPNTFAYQPDNLNFQIRLNETTNTVDIVYNLLAVANSLTTAPQVGLRGASATVYTNRSSTTSWAATTAGTANTASIFLSNTVKPASGLTFTYTPPVPCTAPPTAGAAVATLPNGCGTVTSTLSLTGSAAGTGVTYQWQRSTTGPTGTYTNVTGTGTNATYSATGITVDTYYHAIVTCSGQSATSAPALVSVYSATPAPYATLPVVESFESWTGRCGNLEVPGTNWRATPITGNNSWRRNDQGFSTAAWSYLVNEPAPYPTPASQGSYSARFHTFGTSSGTQGSLSLYADLSAAGTKTLTFDYINPTRDNTTERLDVLLSTDGGVTFPTTLLTLTTSSAFSGQSVTFPATSATSVIRFRATSDFGSDDIGIDNLRLQVTPACPAVAFSPTTAITSTTATVNFAAVTGATSYTVNYSPGGTAQTVTTAAPVVLTGLQPYTTYTVTVTTNCGAQSGAGTTSFRTAIGNDNCVGAVSLTPGAAGDACAGATYTTAGATASPGVTSPCTSGADDDVWFSFVAAGTRHSITVTPTFNFDAVIELRTGSTCPGTNIVCQDASASGGPSGSETLTSNSLTPGATYFVRVYNALTGSGSADFDICITTPANLPCAAVTNAAVTSTSTSATASTGELTFTPATGASTYSLTLAPTAGGTTSTATVTGGPVALNGLTPNTSYTITIATNCFNGGASSVVTVVFTSAAAPAPPANDNCTAATALTVQVGSCTAPTTGTNVGATASAGVTDPTCSSYLGADVWYSFVVPAGGAVTVETGSVSGSNITDTGLTLYTGTCGGTLTQLLCDDDSGTGAFSLITATGLTPGSTIYARVFDYDNAEAGQFTICVSTPPGPPANDNCAGAISLTPGLAGAGCTSPTSGTTVAATASGVANTCGGTPDDDVWYSFVAAATSQTITVAGSASFDAVVELRSGTCAAGTNVACEDNTFAGDTETLVATGLTPGSTYYVRVFDWDAAVYGAFTICITTPGAPPANDNCSGATALTVQAGTCTTPTTGTNVDATASAGVATPACSSYLGGDVWYSFVVPASGAVTVETSAATAVGGITDTGLVLYSGTCGALTQVACDDDSGTDAFSLITATGLTPGSTLYARVFAYDNAEFGQFGICVTTPAPADLTVSAAQSVAGSYNNVTITSTGLATLNGPLNVTGTLTVQSGGVLNQSCQAITGAGSFVLDAGGTLGICDAAGILATGPAGAVQVAGTRSYSADANYVYNGTQAQVTGAALPATVRSLSVNNGLDVTLSQPLSVTQLLRLQNGDLITGSQAFTLLSSASGTALIDNSGGVVNGPGTMQRAITSSVSGPAYRHFSSPVSSTSLADLSTAGFSPVLNSAYNSAAAPNMVTPFPTVFGYDEGRIATTVSTYNDFDKGWFSPASLTAPMLPTRGYTVNAPATATPIDFTGTFNNGAQNSGALARGSNAQAGWHLLGNPYPAPLDWSTVGTGQRPGMDAAVYVYQSSGQYTGTFRSYVNGVGGTEPLIDAGSGYFVRVTAAGTPGAVNLTNANRVTTFGTQPAFGRGTTDARPLLGLQVTGAGLTDVTHLYFDALATAALDAEYDAVKLPNTTGLNLASLVGNQAVAINGLPALAGARETVVPLTLAAPVAGRFSFEVARLANFGSTTVYLRDALTGTEQPLTSGTPYSFTLATALSGQARFALVFRPAGALATAPAFEAGQVSVYPNPAHGKFTVLLPPVAGQRVVQAALLNVLGQVVTTRVIALTAAGATAEFDTQALAKGVYVLRLTAGPSTLTQRVTVE
jgi:hypothetical protein